MSDPHLRYQPVIASDSTVSVHEIIVGSGDELISVSFEPVKLQATSFGELYSMLRQIYRHMQKTPPITDDELDELLFSRQIGSDENTTEEDNIIDLVTYMSDPKYAR